jgi:spore coat protein CotH
MISFSQIPMPDQPDGNCMTCDTCDDSYIVCESNEVDAYFDKMNNCAPGSDTEILILDGC